MPQCVLCEKRFVTKSAYQNKCNRCRESQPHRNTGELRFIGVDGEGVTRPDGTHEYVLLSVGSRSLFHEDGSVLTFYDIMPFLWDCFLDDPEAVYIGFYLGYDFTNWLRHLPVNRAHMLLSADGIAKRRRTKSGANHLPFPVEHRGFNFDLLGMKRLRMWRDGSSHRMYICDTGAYFQTSFLNAINPKQWPDGTIVTEDEYKKIAVGKSERGLGVVPYGTPIDAEMLEYNILENAVLGRLMKRYAEGLDNVGLKLRRDQWFGPGQAAQSWLNLVKAPTRKEFENATNLEIRAALRSSYYGGWFEIFAHGHIPETSWSYDINSAYPHIQSKLPCALHGVWSENDSSPFTLLYATITGTHPYIGVAPYRLRHGNILRPQQTKGWYWQHEVEAGRAIGIIDSISVEKRLAYTPCDCGPVFGKLRQLYEDRIKVGKNTIAGKARRLIYNSTYGKTAQSIGVAKYANPFYASLITSLCRTMILECIRTHPHGANDVLMVATDGITFKHRHTGDIHLGETTLGAWSESSNSNLTLFMPGIYWDDKTRSKLADGEHPSLKSRGIPARALAERILQIDRLFDDCYSGNGFPIFELPIGFSLVTPKQALARRKWETCGNVTTDSIRRIDSDPSIKRSPDAFIENGIIRTYCYRMGADGLNSTPYSRTFGDEELDELLRFILTQDGDFSLLVADALRND
jgi:hypothetical protein